MARSRRTVCILRSLDIRESSLAKAKYKTTLDPYTQEDTNETRAAQGEFPSAVEIQCTD
jgi:hypothetical protein